MVLMGCPYLLTFDEAAANVEAGGEWERCCPDLMAFDEAAGNVEAGGKWERCCPYLLILDETAANVEAGGERERCGCGVAVRPGTLDAVPELLIS